MTASGATIYALSTPPGRGAVAVVRVSGPAALISLEALTPGAGTVPPRSSRLRRLHWKGQVLDEALVLAFAAPESFTGENVVEYHLHGGVAVVQAVLHALSQQEHHRSAEPGEFTRRAFEHGKLDLTEAEAIADLVDAQTQAQRLLALDQLGGSLQSLYEGWADQLTRLLALLEADLDFSDQDLPDDMLVKVRPDISRMVAEVEEHLNDNRRGERLRDGIRIAVLGAPNAGKSSLVNALARREIAIVSPTAGTTRDIIEAHLDVAGYPVIVADTAGLRPEQLGAQGQDAIEAEGIRRALDLARAADLRVLVFDGSAPADPHTLALLDDAALVVLNKADLPRAAGLPEGIALSAKDEAGLNELLQAIAQRLEALAGRRDTPTLTRARHREALEKALVSLRRFETAPLPELAAEDLRLALRHLGSITGRVDIEDLLDLIFRDFCIGK